MLSSTALGVPRFSITSERRSSSTRRRSLPKLVRARRAETTMLSFFCVLGIESTHQLNYTNCTVPLQLYFSTLRYKSIISSNSGSHCGRPVVFVRMRAWSFERSSFDRGHGGCIHRPVFPCVVNFRVPDHPVEFHSYSGIVALVKRFGVMPLHAVRNNQVVAVATRARAASR